MINIKELFDMMPSEILDNQRKIESKAKVKIYYGLTSEGMKRISFLSSCRPFAIESTKLIKVLQLNESENVYWTCFDLLDSQAESAYFSLVEDLIDSVEVCMDELSCMKEIKNRFTIWKKMLGRQLQNGMSEEKVRGLFGELYFLYTYMIPEYGYESAIKSWGGPDGDSKDFSILNIWYEIKAIGLNTNEVNISSLGQLDSDVPGYLSVVKIEAMSDMYNDGLSCIEDIVRAIFNKIDDLSIKSLFINKLDRVKYSPIDDGIKKKFKSHGITRYLVNDSFPRICAKDIKYPEIDKISYTLYIKSIDRFKEV